MKEETMENHHILEETDQMCYLEAVWDPNLILEQRKGNSKKKKKEKQEVQVKPVVQ